MPANSATPSADKPTPHVINVSSHGLEISSSGETLSVPFAQFPWFRAADVRDLIEVERISERGLRWPALDVDLSLESIRTPERFPLVSRTAR